MAMVLLFLTAPLWPLFIAAVIGRFVSPLADRDHYEHDIEADPSDDLMGYTVEASPLAVDIASGAASRAGVALARARRRGLVPAASGSRL